MKKAKFLPIFLCLVMCVSAFVGCGKQKSDTVPQNTVTAETKVTTLPFGQPLDFGLSSGAGAWYTSLTLKPDGTFTGSYHNSEMGNVGDGYPLGTVYCSEFSGKFTEIEKIDDYSYTMKLSELVVENEDEEYIEDEIRYVVSKPSGMDGIEYVFYVPQTPVEMLSDDFLSWKMMNDSGLKTLSVYGLENKTTGIGFFSY